MWEELSFAAYSLLLGGDFNVVRIPHKSFGPVIRVLLCPRLTFFGVPGLGGIFF